MRLPTVKRDDLSPENQQRWDRITAGRTSGGGGPYSALIHAPLLADLLATAENYYRKDAALAEADRELVILATAREFETHYPWTRHEIRGRQVGLREEAIETIRAHGSLEKLMPRERLLRGNRAQPAAPTSPVQRDLHPGSRRAGAAKIRRAGRAHRPLQHHRFGGQRL